MGILTGPTALVIPGVACCMAGGVLWIVSKVQKQKVDDLKELKELTSLQGKAPVVALSPFPYGLSKQRFVFLISFLSTLQRWP